MQTTAHSRGCIRDVSIGEKSFTHLDTRQNYGEDRWIGIGLLKHIVAVTVFLEWEDEETIRIISARKATRHESKEYNKRITH